MELPRFEAAHGDGLSIVRRPAFGAVVQITGQYHAGISVAQTGCPLCGGGYLGEIMQPIFKRTQMLIQRWSSGKRLAWSS